MNLQLIAKGYAADDPSRAGSLRPVLATARKHPRELYWRSRVLQCATDVASKGAERKFVFESLLRVLAADPGLFVQRGLPVGLFRRWTWSEAGKAAAALKWRDATARATTLAVFWWGVAHRIGERNEALKAARAAIESISERRRTPLHAELLGELLIRLEPEAFTSQLSALLALALDHPVQSHLVVNWLEQVADWADARPFKLLVARFNEMPEHARSPRDRVALASIVGARALQSGDLGTAEASLREMIALSTTTEFLGNPETMSLARALVAQRKLLPLVRDYLTGVLKSDWREWVRPEIEKLLASF